MGEPNSYPGIRGLFVCIDQANIRDGLKVLPINVMACDKVLALCGNTYTGRLWCMWELFTVVAFLREEQAMEKIQLETLGDAVGADGNLLGELAAFDV